MMTKVWIIEASSAVGGLLERLKDIDPHVKYELSPYVANLNYWLLEVRASRALMANIEDEVAAYV